MSGFRITALLVAITLTTVISVSPGFSQANPWFYFEIGDTLTVIAPSGVNLRDSSAAAADKIAVIPFGQVVIAQSHYEGRDEFENRKGSWMRVKYGDREGYLFSGFLTRMRVPAFNTDELDCYYLTWFERFFRVNADSLVYEGSTTYEGFDPDGKDWGASNWEAFSDETVIKHYTGYEYKDLILESTEITMNDVLNLLEYYVAQLKANCPATYYRQEGNSLGIEVKKDFRGWIKRIECYQIEFVAERTVDKVAIRLRSSG